MQKLINSVQNYAWGSKTALTDLYGIANPDNLPMAELWMGAHPKSSSKIEDASGQVRSLRDVIDADKAALLKGGLPAGNRALDHAMTALLLPFAHLADGI